MGQNDSGLFEASLRDERYLPFEGAGAISEWELELAKDFPAFDFETISDVVLHIRYTARDASGTLKGPATAALKNTLKLVIEGKEPLAGWFARGGFPGGGLDHRVGDAIEFRVNAASSKPSGG